MPRHQADRECEEAYAAFHRIFIAAPRHIEAAAMRTAIASAMNTTTLSYNEATPRAAPIAAGHRPRTGAAHQDIFNKLRFIACAPISLYSCTAAAHKAHHADARQGASRR